MSEKLTKIDASPKSKQKGDQRDLRADMPANAEEFEVLLGRYKRQNPEKYEEKLADGTFVKQAKALGISWGKEEKKEEPKEEKPKVEKKEKESKKK